MTTTGEYILGLDYGAQRVGVAIAHGVARLPRALGTLPNDNNLLVSIQQLLDKEKVARIVVGVPRQMDGSESAQSLLCREFATMLQKTVDLPVVTVDETLTSVEAAGRLKNAKLSQNGIDAEAAAIILERYFDGNNEGQLV